MSVFDKLRRQKLLSFTLILFTLSIGIVIGTLINSGSEGGESSITQRRRRDAAGDSQSSPVIDTFTQIAKQVEPSVVNISTTYLPKPAAQSRNAAAPGRRRPTMKIRARAIRATEAAWRTSSSASSAAIRSAAPDMQQHQQRSPGFRAWWWTGPATF